MEDMRGGLICENIIVGFGYYYVESCLLSQSSIILPAPYPIQFNPVHFISVHPICLCIISGGSAKSGSHTLRPGQLLTIATSSPRGSCLLRSLQSSLFDFLKNTLFRFSLLTPLPGLATRPLEPWPVSFSSLSNKPHIVPPANQDASSTQSAS